ncbi:hypothetical protein [Nostoc sp.]|uniref:hypothetical protein n=1 Tax=Nostoc sp. TaxID=1180 RepID=UPI002FF7C1A9
MKTTDELKARIKELGKQAADYSRQGVELTKLGDRKQGHQMMKQANEASKRCRVLLDELFRREPPQ